MYLRTCGSLKSANLETSQIADSQSATFAEGPQIYHITVFNPQMGICDLRNLFADRPPLGLCRLYVHTSSLNHVC
jgi:hypothetical protein